MKKFINYIICVLLQELIFISSNITEVLDYEPLKKINDHSLNTISLHTLTYWTNSTHKYHNLIDLYKTTRLKIVPHVNQIKNLS